jgi:hypothetical protein
MIPSCRGSYRLKKYSRRGTKVQDDQKDAIIVLSVFLNVLGILNVSNPPFLFQERSQGN